MPRDPLAWQPLMRHWTRCLGEGGSALAQLGDLEMLDGLNLAKLLPGGPGWADVQRSLRHDPESTFRLLYYSLALRGLEALPAPERLLSRESPEVPQVSVLIPVHNHWAITLNCLRSLVAMVNTTSFEVIIADDASSDATTQLSRQLPWLQIWRSEKNQGFLDTCNNAATLTRGEILLLLNNDVLVGDHCLDRLAATFDRHSEAGVVGAASWSADGRPQEVGGIIWADGQVWNHGRGFLPEHWFALEYERQTDYVSGCALAIRRQLWRELEGFDPRYRPAYCEDTDLCLRVRQAGRRVWVQPAARILHMEGLSHSRSTEQGLKAHQLRNLEQLRQRWQRLLDTEQPPAHHPWVIAADRGLLGRPLALLLQPSEAAIRSCDHRGYGVVSLGKCPQANVLDLPLGSPNLESWLLEQLPDTNVLEVVLLGVQEGVAGELATRLQRVRPQWQAQASLEDLASQSPVTMLPALPGWDRKDLRVLASSNGLHEDGWLEIASRLVIQLIQRAASLRLQLYLPEMGLAAGDPAVLLHLEHWVEPRKVDLHPGLNVIEVQLEPEKGHYVVLNMSGQVLVRPGNIRDQRLLLALLNDLQVVNTLQRP